MAKQEAQEHEKTKDKPAGDAARDFSYTQNRELSWLRFDDRVLEEATDESVPLYERLKFASIFQSNLDEWFMIRFGGLSDLAALKKQPRENKTNMTPAEQVEALLADLPKHIRQHEKVFTEIEAALADNGLARVHPADFREQDKLAAQVFWERNILPVLSPLVIDPRHPFPNLRNGELYVACSLEGEGESKLIGLVELPQLPSRIIALPPRKGAFRYVLAEDLVLSMLGEAFGKWKPSSPAVIRVTRNADIDPDGEGVAEEEDYRQHMKKVLKRRLRLAPVRLEIQGELDAKARRFITKRLGLDDAHVFQTSVPLDTGYVFELEGHIPEARRAELCFEPFEPQPSSMVQPGIPLRDQVRDHDILLFYPYESMDPLLELARDAAADDSCISIKVTLYRVARQSRLCESLVAAAEAGKEVTVLMELRARFDEQNNIEWAERLEQAGVIVIYGSEGFKCHSKIMQITYHDEDGISRITCLGTGNFNEKTARLYSDFMLLTADEGIAADGTAFFRDLSLGNLDGSYDYLGVAPRSLKPLVMRGIEREIARARDGQPARVFLKMNSLTDRDVIDKIAEACQAGVEVDMIVRGICCIKPNVSGKTDGLNIRQIVGRFLEHARVYAFGADNDLIYLSSADMMTRNTERRVEIAYPVLDEHCRALVKEYMALQLADNVKARRLTSKGTWEKVKAKKSAERIDCQQALIDLAIERSQRDARPQEAAAPVARSAAAPSQAEQPKLALEPEAAPAQQQAPRGRFRAAFSLMGRALRTLVSGTDEGAR